MEISLNTSVSGLRASEIRMISAAHAIANVNTPQFKPSISQQTDVLPQGTRISSFSQSPTIQDGADNLITATKEAIISKDTFSANAKAVKMQDRMTGTLLDLIA